MKILTVKYEKPFTERQQQDGVAWTFVISLDETLAHGYAGIGGELRRTADGWEARHFEATPWGTAALDRKTAIENALPSIVEAVAKHKTERDEKEKREREEYLKQQRIDKQQAILHKHSMQLLSSVIALLPSAEELLADMMEDPTPLRGSGWQSLQDEIKKASELVETLKKAGL